MKEFGLDSAAIKSGLDDLAKRDPAIKDALDLVGYPEERRRPAGFDTFARVIVGQQLSVKAAQTIWTRVAEAAGPDITPNSFSRLDDTLLREKGLSRQKISYMRSLCEAVITGSLNPDGLHHLPDEEAIAMITKVKGLGRWSAEMYLMFSLGRQNIWPVDDLAVRVGAGRIIGREKRPTPKELMVIGEKWTPWRSMVALLAWHYYANAPM